MPESSTGAIHETTLHIAVIGDAPSSVAAIDETKLDGFASTATLTGSVVSVTL